MNESWLLKLSSAIAECDIHLRRLARSRSLLEDFFPITAGDLALLDDARVEHIDQFIYRFTKLQDAIGMKLYPSLIAILEGDDKPRPFLDVLAALEKYGVLADANLWQFFRNLRNSFAHDYPENLDQTVDSLNTLYSRWAEFEGLYANVRTHVVRRGFLGSEAIG